VSVIAPTAIELTLTVIRSDWIHAKENTIVLEEEEQGVVMAGGIAREVLREWI
jgi:hypothetical protein